MSINDLRASLNNISITSIRNWYDKNRQSVLIGFIVVGCIFFAFYWTEKLISAKEQSYVKASERTYERLEDVLALVVKIQDNSNTASSMTTGLLSFLQTTSTDSGMGDRLANIRSIPSSEGLEHASLRVENLYYDELINFITKIERYDNLYIKVLNFNRRYDNDKKIDVTIEVVKS